MIDIIIAVLCLVLIPVGVCGLAAVVGYFGTAKHRLEHQRELFELNERAKLNAIVIQERQAKMLMSAPQETHSY